MRRISRLSVLRVTSASSASSSSPLSVLTHSRQEESTVPPSGLSSETVRSSKTLSTSSQLHVEEPHGTPAAASFLCALTGRIVPVDLWEKHALSLEFRVASMVSKRLSGESATGDTCKPKSTHREVLSDLLTAAPRATGPSTATENTNFSVTMSGTSVSEAAAAVSSSSSPTFSWSRARNNNNYTTNINNKTNSSGTSTSDENESTNSSNSLGPNASKKSRPPMFVRLQKISSKPLEPLPIDNIWPTVTRNVKLLHEFNIKKRTRRLSRIHIALKFLRDHHVIMHAPLRWCPSAEVRFLEEQARLLVEKQLKSAAAAATMAATNKIPSLSKILMDAKGANPSSTVPLNKDSSLAADKNYANNNNNTNNSDNVHGEEGSLGSPCPPSAASVAVEKEEQNRRFFVKGARAGQWNVSKPFQRLLLNGEALLTSETTTRLSKLFPKANDPEAFSELTLRCLSDESLAKLFDDCYMGRIIEKQGRRASPPTAYQKACMVKTVLCELFWFCERTRANDRTHNNALFPPSDVLILHVLASHVVESLCGEVVFTQIEPVANRTRKYAWPRYSDSLVHQFAPVLGSKASPFFAGPSSNNIGGSSNGAPKTINVLSLLEAPRPFDPSLDGMRSVTTSDELLSIVAPLSSQSQQSSKSEKIGTNRHPQLIEKHVAKALSAALDSAKNQFDVVKRAKDKKEKALIRLKERLANLVRGTSDVRSDAAAATTEKPNPDENDNNQKNADDDSDDDNAFCLDTQTSKIEAPDGLTEPQHFEKAIANAERKLRNITIWIEKYEVRVAKMEEKIRSQITKRFENDLGDFTSNLSSSSFALCSSLQSPFGLVPPLLHTIPVHRESLVTVPQSGVSLNYKLYRRVDATPREIETFMDKKNKWIGGEFGYGLASAPTRMTPPAVASVSAATISLKDALAMLSSKKKATA